MDLKERAKKLKTDIPAIFLTLKDRNTPLIAKILAGLTVCYALSPIDLIPDFIPVPGYPDDIILLPALIALTIRFIPKAVWEKNRIRARHMRDGEIPERWFYALPILLLWFLIIWMIIKMTAG